MSVEEVAEEDGATTAAEVAGSQGMRLPRLPCQPQHESHYAGGAAAAVAAAAAAAAVVGQRRLDYLHHALGAASGRRGSPHGALED